MSGLGLYILDGKTPRHTDDLMEWGRWFEREHALRVVGYTVLDNSHVSTCFIGIDMNYWGKGPPLLFETMIFGGPQDGWQDRYATWKEAEDGHAKAVTIARTFGKIDIKSDSP